MQSSTNLEKNPIKNATIPITEKNNIENTEKVQESNEEVIPIGTLKNFSLKCEPFLYYSNTISNLSGFFWEIKLECWDDLGQYITLYLDDQTGKIMLISYDCLEPIYSKKVLKDYVVTIFTYYQDTMDWFEYERVDGEQQESSYSAETLTYTIGDIVYGEHKHTPIFTVSEEAKDFTVVMNSPSKTFNLAGFYSAFVILHNEEMRAAYQEVYRQFHFDYNFIGMEALITAYDECEYYVDQQNEYFAKSRPY